MSAKSLGDDAAWVAAHLWKPRPDASPAAKKLYPRNRGPVSWVAAPCCRGKVRADEILDLRASEAIALDGVCPTCEHRIVADPGNPWTRASLHQAAGMAWPHVRKLLAHDALKAARRAHIRETPHEPFHPDEVLRAAHHAAGAKRRDLVRQHHHVAELAATARGRL